MCCQPEPLGHNFCPQGTCYCWVGRGRGKCEVYLTLLHMPMSGNWTPDCLILHPMPYPLRHTIPRRKVMVKDNSLWWQMLTGHPKTLLSLPLCSYRWLARELVGWYKVVVSIVNNLHWSNITIKLSIYFAEIILYSYIQNIISRCWQLMVI